MTTSRERFEAWKSSLTGKEFSFFWCPSHTTATWAAWQEAERRLAQEADALADALPRGDNLQLADFYSLPPAQVAAVLNALAAYRASRSSR